MIWVLYLHVFNYRLSIKLSCLTGSCTLHHCQRGVLICVLCKRKNGKNMYFLYSSLARFTYSEHVTAMSLHITRRQDNWMGRIRIKVIKLENRKVNVQHSYASAPARSFGGSQNLAHLLPFWTECVGYTLVCVISRYNNIKPDQHGFKPKIWFLILLA